MKFFAERIDKDCIARVERFVSASFERMTYTDAITALEKSGKTFEFPVHWGMDLQSEHERWLTEEHVGRPVVVMNYPKEIKAFYMRQNDDGKTVAAMDVLAPGIGEIIGGSQREERLDVLDQRLAESDLDPKGVLVVPRSAALRHRAARRLRPGPGADDHLRHRHGQHPRRHPLPPRPRPGRLLAVFPILVLVLVLVAETSPPHGIGDWHSQSKPSARVTHSQWVPAEVHPCPSMPQKGPRWSQSVTPSAVGMQLPPYEWLPAGQASNSPSGLQGGWSITPLVSSQHSTFCCAHAVGAQPDAGT